MPLLLRYRGRKLRPITNIELSNSKNMKPEDIRKATDEAEKKIRAAAQAQPEQVDFFIRLTEYKRVGGLLLPHKLTFLTESEVSEEFQVAKYQVNPQFKPDTFQKR
jgi:hypothetical protein